MRIGIDARFYGGEQSKGLGRYTQKLIEQLVEYDQSNEYVIFLQTEQFEQWHFAQPHVTPVHAPYRWYTLAEQLFMPIQIWRAKVDCMHFPHFNVPLLYRKPFIVTIHDLIIMRFPTQRATTLGPLLYRLKHWAGQIVMKHAIKHSWHILTVSEFSKQDIVEYYQVSPEKITVTYEAADIGDSCKQQSTHAILQKYQVREPYLLYVGNAYPHKNLERLIDVVKTWKKQYPQTHWQMVFVGKEDYFYARLKQEVWLKDVENDVVFTGFVPDAELPCLYQHARAYVFPSYYEGFGLPPLEAMAYGIPVLAARTSCLPEVLGDAALYFDPDDTSGIIEAIQEILHSDDVRSTLVEKGYRQVKKYSWKSMMEETIQVYEQFQKEQSHT